MKAKVYYQDFDLNAGIFDPHGLIVLYDKATFIREITKQDCDKCYEPSVPPCDISKEEMAEKIWIIMNNLRVPVGHKDRHLFEEAGHTSMSVGDYIEFEDGEVWVVAGCGWKIIPLIEYNIFFPPKNYNTEWRQ